MKEKFDFTAEMNEAKTVKNNPHNVSILFSAMTILSAVFQPIK